MWFLTKLKCRISYHLLYVLLWFVSGEISEAEVEAEMEEYEEEEVEAEHTMSLSQMLNQHRADDNYYGYDDEDY